MASIKTIGLVANSEKKEVRTIIPKLVNFCSKKGWKVEKVTADPVKIFHGVKKNLPRYNFLLALGGDGTILKAARFAQPQGLPLLGINVGSLGFLACGEKRNLYPILERVLKEKYTLEERTMLKIEVYPVKDQRSHGVYRGKKSSTSSDLGKNNYFLALNDCVFRNPHSARTINLELKIDQQLVTRYLGDGLIISTATGSTAYNLAAGGPLVAPELAVFILTPICPHSLTLRPLIVPEEKEISIRILSNDTPILLSMDGQEETNLKIGDQVRVKKAEKGVSFILPKGRERNYFTLLRGKFKWG